MNSLGVKLCVFLFLTVEGTQGSELTINVRKNASVTLVCSSMEDLRMCYCPSYPQNCNKCTDMKTLTSPVEIHSDRYFKLSGLKHSSSGLYVCYSSRYRKLGKKYSLNVFEDRNPTVVIGTVGQSIVMSCGTELDIMAASEKHWCRLANSDVCQPDTIMGPENESRGDFKILDSHSSFSLKKHQLTHSDTGFYRFTQIFQNETKVCVVKLQVKDKPNFLQISPVREKPKPGEHFEIKCQYSQELQEFSKSWLCDNSECPETVKSVDDRFQSALVLTIDHVACSNIRSFQCVAKTSGSSVESSVYRKPLNQNPIVSEYISVREQNKEVQVIAYSLLNLICLKPWEYDGNDWGRDRWGLRNEYLYYGHVNWCRVSHSQCQLVKENVQDKTSSLTLQICVTPNDDGTRYCCSSGWTKTDVKIVVITPPPPTQPVTRAVRPITSRNIPSSSGTEHSVGIIIVVTSIILLIIILCVTVTRYKGQRLRERCFVLFARRTPLSAVDIHANVYANSVAHYYSHHRRQVPPPDKQGEGGEKETSSSSDDEFEELPIRPKTSSSVMPEETDYVRVKPGASAHINAFQRDSEQCEDATQSSSGRSNNKEDDDEDEVTYSHVIIKPKHGLK